MQVYMNYNIKITKYIWIRKGIHLLAFILPISYYYFFSRSQFIVLVGILTGIAIIIETLRFNNIKVKVLFYKIVGKMLWDHESKTITGATTFIIASFICAFLFSKPVVVIGLLFLTLGDTAAYFIGRFGKTKIGKRTLYGILAFLVISITIILLTYPDINLLTGIIGALVACIVEALPWKVDDNLSIPLISCSIMQLLNP